MNDYVYVGKIINTFGIKGELKIITDFEYQDRVFKNGFSLYVGEDKSKEIIKTFKIHKGSIIISLNNINNINDVLKYKSMDIYIKKDDLNLSDNEFLTTDLIGFKVYDNDKLLGEVVNLEYSKLYILLKVHGNKDFYLPNIPKFINKIDFQNKKIYTNDGSELVL